MSYAIPPPLEFDRVTESSWEEEVLNDMVVLLSCSVDVAVIVKLTGTWIALPVFGVSVTVASLVPSDNEPATAENVMFPVDNPAIVTAPVVDSQPAPAETLGVTVTELPELFVTVTVRVTAVVDPETALKVTGLGSALMMLPA